MRFKRAQDWESPSTKRVSEGSNPTSYPKTAFGIYGNFNKKSGSKNPERLDAVGFAPTASKVLGCYGAGGGTRTHTMSPSADFESATSTNSITPASYGFSLYRKPTQNSRGTFCCLKPFKENEQTVKYRGKSEERLPKLRETCYHVFVELCISAEGRSRQ